MTKAVDGFHRIYVDTSACSPEDNYDRRQGFQAAFKRALFYLRHGYPRDVKVEWEGRLTHNMDVENVMKPTTLHWRWPCKAVVPEKKVPALGRATRDWLREQIETMTKLPLSKRVGVKL
jgi:hypothetical protein